MIKSQREFDEGLKKIIENYFKNIKYQVKTTDKKSLLIPFNILYGFPEGEFKTSEYEKSLTIYFYFLNEGEDYRRDCPEVEYLVESETDKLIKIKEKVEKLDLYYIIGYQTNSQDKGSFLWTEFRKFFGGRGQVIIDDTSINYFKDDFRKRDIYKTSGERIIWREYVYKFCVTMDIKEGEWYPKVLTDPIILTQQVSKDVYDETGVWIADTEIEVNE